LSGRLWKLEDFLQSVDAWIEREDPPQEFVLATLSWVHSLQTDPYRRGVPKRGLGPMVWFADVPDIPSESQAVVCTYTIDEVEGVVRCWVIAGLSRPI
jgi:hypothetical protein